MYLDIKYANIAYHLVAIQLTNFLMYLSNFSSLGILHCDHIFSMEIVLNLKKDESWRHKIASRHSRLNSATEKVSQQDLPTYLCEI